MIYKLSLVSAVSVHPGVDVNAKMEISDWVALPSAASAGHTEIVRMLLDAGADLNENSGAALTTAAGSGHTEIVQMLLEKGADVNATRGDGLTPLMTAAGGGNVEIVKLLLERGACATKQQHYRGIKLHFIAARRRAKLPLPEKVHLSRASQHDLSALREVSPSLPAGCGLFADKAYFHRDTQAACKERGWFLVAAYKRYRHETEKDVPTLYNRFVSAMRQPLESLFNWLIQTTDLQNASRVRSSQGLKVHCYGKLAVACLLFTFYS